NPKGDIYYFLWSVERVAVAYGLKTIGNRDWYEWGSKYLLDNQGKDGGWVGRYEGGVDTCFALLFLRRANLAVDLSARLKGVKDPGERNLRAGGVGGDKLQKDPNETKPETKPEPGPEPPTPREPPP